MTPEEKARHESHGFDAFDEFMRHTLEAFPEATVGEDSEKQLVIYTNLFEDVASQAIVSMELIVPN